MNTSQLLAEIVKAMENDNCCGFTITKADLAEAAGPLQQLLNDGYFANGDSSDIDSDVWMAAAGEFTEVRIHFSRSPEAYAALDVVLERIFEGMPDEDPVATPETDGQAA